MRRIEDGVIDEVAIERACAGENLPLTPTEQRIAVRRLAGQGRHCTDISRLLHLNGTRARQLLNEVTQDAEYEQEVA